MQHNDSTTPIRIYYALYDSDTENSRTISGVDQKVFWTWWSDELAGSPQHIYKMCNGLHAKLPQNDGKVWGGFLRYENYTVLYRFFDAGLYGDGRVGHYVILTAWIKTAETLGKDLTDVLYDEVFQFVDKGTAAYIANKTAGCPIPEPPRLLLKIVGKMSVGADSLMPQFSWKSEYRYERDDALARAMATGAADNGHRVLSAKIESSENGQCAVFELKPLPPPKTPMSRKISNEEDAIEEGSSNLPGKNVSIIAGLLTVFCVLIIGLFLATVVMIPKNILPTNEGGSGKPPTDPYVIMPPATDGGRSWSPPSQLPPSKPSTEEVKRLFKQLHITEQLEMFNSLHRDQKLELLANLETDDQRALFERLRVPAREALLQSYFRHLRPEEQQRLLQMFQNIHAPSGQGTQR